MDERDNTSSRKERTCTDRELIRHAALCGLIILFLALLCFFIGLAIDFSKTQPAYFAWWGLVIGVTMAIAFCLWLSIKWRRKISAQK